MIGRLIWIGALLAVGAGTAGIQLDRQARYVPTLASSVPEPFRAFSQRHNTVDALTAEQHSLALKEARALVAKRPMPAEHLRLLSLAEVNADEAEKGVYSIQLAARRGWRDRPAQRTMFQLALAAGDEPEAARRFAALFVRRSETDAQLRALANSLFGAENEAARSTFAQIVADAERWHRIYLRKGPVVFSPEVFVDLTERAVAQGAQFDCARVKTASKQLGRSDNDAAKALEASVSGC